MTRQKTRKKSKEIVLDPPYYDDEERDIIESLKRGEWKPVANEKQLMANLREAARAHLLKNQRINIRLPNRDLIAIKNRAENDGLPYQTLIASVLHKFATGQFDDKR